ncbi:MAG: hypothetical protein V2J19_03720 [Wenzhouxiangella sp.]|jgi:hypothetical protein|nr:hypothetical protein [Wenzhouxiangella sp.]
MQINEETQLEQQVPDQGTATASTPASPGASAPAAKKAAKKKATKKKVSKKASKKKASKKKASAKAADGDMAQVLAAVDQLRDALHDLASHQINQRRQLVEELRTAARSGFSEVETAARKTLNRLTGKG